MWRMEGSRGRRWPVGSSRKSMLRLSDLADCHPLFFLIIERLWAWLVDGPRTLLLGGAVLGWAGFARVRDWWSLLGRAKDTRRGRKSDVYSSPLKRPPFFTHDTTRNDKNYMTITQAGFPVESLVCGRVGENIDCLFTIHSISSTPFSLSVCLSVFCGIKRTSPAFFEYRCTLLGFSLPCSIYG